jgi:hypothetical protein
VGDSIVGVAEVAGIVAAVLLLVAMMQDRARFLACLRDTMDPRAPKR